MTRLDERALALAAGAVTAVVFSLCALWIAISPHGFMATIGYLLHIDLAPLARAVTLASYLAGVVCVSLFVAVVVGATGAIYNRLARAGLRRSGTDTPVTITRDAGMERTIR